MLYLNTCISSGEFRTSSWRRRQRRQALSSRCSWASWGASCLEHRHTNTNAQDTVTVVFPRSRSHHWSSRLCFRGDGTDSPRRTLRSIRKGLLGPQTKNQPSLLHCLFGRCLLAPEPPPAPSPPPLAWKEQTSLGSHFHSDPIQPFPALSSCTGWERSPPFTSYFFQPSVLLRAVYSAAS